MNVRWGRSRSAVAERAASEGRGWWLLREELWVRRVRLEGSSSAPVPASITLAAGMAVMTGYEMTCPRAREKMCAVNVSVEAVIASGPETLRNSQVGDLRDRQKVIAAECGSAVPGGAAAEKAGDVDAVEHAVVRGGVLPDGGGYPADSDLRDGLAVGVVCHFVSPVRCGRDCPSAHVELAEGDERPGQEAVRERWQEEQERSGNGRDRDRR